MSATMIWLLSASWGLGRFNPDAAAVNRWTAQQLSDEDRQYLEGLPQVIEKGEFTIVHGSPREPIWEYVISKGVAGKTSPISRASSAWRGIRISRRYSG